MKAQDELPKGIRLRGAKFFVDISKDGRRMTATCETREEAEKKREELATLLENGDEQAAHTAKAHGGGWTLGQAFDRCCEEHWAGTPGEESSVTFARQSLEFFGKHHPLKDIDTEAGISYVRHCVDVKKNGPATISKKVSCLRMIIRHAMKYKNSGVTAVPEISVPKRHKRRKRYLTAVEEEAILSTLEQWGLDDHWDCVKVLIQTGMRPIELFHVQPADLGSAKGSPHGVLTIQGRDNHGTKNGDVRSVPLLEESAGIIARRLKGLKPTDRVFPYTNTWMRHVWDNMRAHLGYASDRDFTPYICRHTCCSRLVISGTHLPAVQKWMGHKSITQTMEYAHLAPTDLYVGVDNLVELSGGSKKQPSVENIDPDVMQVLLKLVDTIGIENLKALSGKASSSEKLGLTA